ncbi:MAG TPA: hypothetical protein DHV55_02055, partial [Clostridiaceae bacterium]|nr:hypothetical protein [Clostridiaceae bacterium]
MKGNFSSDKVVLSDDAAQPLKGEEALRGYKSAEPFIPDNRDVIFAFLAFVLGFFFARWVLFSWQGWGVTAFTIGYCLAVTMYLMKKGVSLSRSGFFWLAAITLTGMSYSLYPNNGLEPWRSLFLFCAAIYYVLHASGRLILCNTGNWLLLDGINGLFVIPFKNFACQ